MSGNERKEEMVSKASNLQALHTTKQRKRNTQHDWHNERERLWYKNWRRLWHKLQEYTKQQQQQIEKTTDRPFFREKCIFSWNLSFQLKRDFSSPIFSCLYLTNKGINNRATYMPSNIQNIIRRVLIALVNKKNKKRFTDSKEGVIESKKGS